MYQICIFMKKTLLVLLVVVLSFLGCRKVDVFDEGTETVVKDGKILGCAVDLGLPSGLKWSDRNLGTGDLKGDYYDYDFDYDVVTNELGDGWRLPTESEYEELISECTWTWTTKGGISDGYEVTGPNGNSIFLPAAGYYGTTTLLQNGEYGYYMSSTLSNYNVSVLQMNCAGYFMSTFTIGEYRRSVRPVNR